MSIERLPEHEQHSVAVVGGGLAGLIATVKLAQAGRTVTLFESASNLGGRAMTREVEGFRFNLGPRALYVSGEGKAVLDELGVAYRGHKPPLGNGSALVNGGVGPLPIGLWSLMTCPWMTVRERFEVASFLARLPKLAPSSLRGRSTSEWLSARLSNKVSRDLIEALLRLTTYSADLEQLSAEAASRQLQAGLLSSVLYLDGGWQTLVDSLKGLALQAGAQIETGCKIRQIRADSDRVVLETERGEHIATAAVLAVGPQQASRLLGSTFKEVEPSAEACRPLHAACLDLALRRLPRPDRLFAQGIDCPFYFSVHSAAADLAPEGAALVHVLRYLRADESLTRVQSRQELEGVMDQMQPGWRDELVDQQLLPAMLVAHDMPSPGRKRAGHRLSNNLYLAGDWVGDQGLLADCSIAGGRRAAMSILEMGSSIREQRHVA